MKIINVVGARPNFMKITPIVKELGRHHQIQQLLVHTEQHYDAKMSKLFFEDLKLPRPDIALGIGSGSHAEQTGKIMIAFEEVLKKERPDLVIVVGDVNSTLACALTACKLGIKVAHVEAGLRSYDRTMPEEINRVLTDAISDFLFITEKSAKENLIKEGVSEEKIHFVGNVMIDTLIKNLHIAKQATILSRLKLKDKEFAVLTLHRPSNVDSKPALIKCLDIIEAIQKQIKIIFPLHPRTKNKIREFKLEKKFNFLAENGLKKSNFLIVEPLGYLDFLSLVMNCKFVITDSGGIQEESTFLRIPCITLRENTERPVTVEEGTNFLTGINRQLVLKTVQRILLKELKFKKPPQFWDGKAAPRIVKIILEELI